MYTLEVYKNLQSCLQSKHQRYSFTWRGIVRTWSPKSLDFTPSFASEYKIPPIEPKTKEDDIVVTTKD